MFLTLLPAIPEIDALKKAIIEGRIDGSTYEGECACLAGTLIKPKNKTIVDRVEGAKDSSRPIEMFFLGISKGDTPNNSEFSKLALDWVVEFQNLIKGEYTFEEIEGRLEL